MFTREIALSLMALSSALPVQASVKILPPAQGLYYAAFPLFVHEALTVNNRQKPPLLEPEEYLLRVCEVPEGITIQDEKTCFITIPQTSDVTLGEYCFGGCITPESHEFCRCKHAQVM